MRTSVVILAGGVGSRMDSSVPKQFMLIKRKPVVVYTIENFQNNDRIDDIVVVCNHDWIDHMNDLVKEFNLTKVKWIVNGGNTSHDSTRNGLYQLKN